MDTSITDSVTEWVRVYGFGRRTSTRGRRKG